MEEQELRLPPTPAEWEKMKADLAAANLQVGALRDALGDLYAIREGETHAEFFGRMHEIAVRFGITEKVVKNENRIVVTRDQFIAKWTSLLKDDLTQPTAEGFIVEVDSIYDALRAAWAERRQMREVLEWLDRLGGLGLNVHDRIRGVLAQHDA